MFRAVVRQLVQHVGGRPSAAQELLIGRLAMLAVHLAHQDERALRDHGMSAHATREYLAWHASFARGLRLLGFAPAAARPPTLAELFAQATPSAAPVPAGDDDAVATPEDASAAPCAPAGGAA